ncbi:MAG: hypothetical protein QHH14_04425 [Clostridiales bacterium]|nr:hypothetical protein [Clostridiales bacterium]
MAHVGVFPVLLTLALFSQTTKRIERAFFQNDAGFLYGLFPSSQHLTVSLPEPISFADHLSSEQAHFLFRKIYSAYATFEFYTDSELPFIAGGKNFIFKSRWSFKNKKDNNQHVFQVFFYLVHEKDNAAGQWRITEIKAEKF